MKQFAIQFGIGIALGIASLWLLLGGLSPVSIAGEGKEATMSGYSKSGHNIQPLPPERIEELAQSLTDEEREIILNQGTELAFCGNLLDNKQEGTYHCRLCALPLFSSNAKFDSGSGWPSFFQPFDPAHVATHEDTTFGFQRVEILCARCGGHLGHVFGDGPKPTGLRYCLNSASLQFFANGDELPEAAKPVEREVAYFAGGCFWGIEDRLQHHEGVIDAVSGYMGGDVPNVTSKIAYAYDTGHAETVRVEYDPEAVSYRQLLEFFFDIHNPTTLNRQGPDVGPLYRSVVFTANEEQRKQAEQYKAELQASDEYKGDTIVTAIEDASEFWPAEEYHQDYHAKRGTSCAIPR